jgi:precorrin-3B synthase
MSARSRGACPSLAAPMPTGDGLLARIVTGGGTIGLDAMAALCGAARRHGNGIIEVSARGSIQVRGLTPASAASFADQLAGFEVFTTGGVPILADPLAGLDPETAIDAGKIAARLRERLAAASFAMMLGPKVSVVVDCGSALHLDAVAADVRLRGAGADVRVALAGDAASATPLGVVDEARAAEAGSRLLEMVARRGPQGRARDVVHDADALSACRGAMGDLLRDAPAPAPRPCSEPIGRHALRGSSVALGIGFAFGHTDAAELAQLIAAADNAGVSGIRTAPGRALLLIGLRPGSAASLAAEAENLGFITRREDTRRYLVACAGAPICAAAEMAARALAPSTCAAARPLLDGSLTLHLSGCAKGCAHPSPSALTIVGGGNGCGVIVSGNARDQALAELSPQALPAALARLAGEIERVRRPGERAADALAGLGASRIARLLGEPGHG